MNVPAGLGDSAIDDEDTDLLYRCLEMLGWLGSAAARADDHDMGCAVLQALVRLGRKARIAGLECFWAGCPLTPADHAFERLGWVGSWVLQLEQERQGRWLQTLATAYGRFSGREHEVTQPEGDGAKLRQTGRPHVESFFVDGQRRELDYSDSALLKQTRLH